MKRMTVLTPISPSKTFPPARYTRKTDNRRTHNFIHCSNNPTKTSQANTDAAASPIAPFWTEFRRQIGKMEGLQGIPIPKYLQQHAIPPIAFRSGAFHSDRLRYGRFLFLNAQGRTVLLGALHPTLYSRHPPFIFQIVYLGSRGWIVSFDCPPLIFPHSSSPITEEHYPSLSDKRLASKLLLIRNQYDEIALPLSEDIRQKERYMSPSACILSSTRLESRNTPRKSRGGRRRKGENEARVQDAEASTRTSNSGSDISDDPDQLEFLRSDTKMKSDDAFQGRAFRAFRAALSAHLDTLVMSPLNASPESIHHVAAAHAAYAKHAIGQDFVGRGALESVFGTAWMKRLKELVLDDAYKLPTAVLNDARSEGIMKSNVMTEYLYFNPRHLN